MGAGDRLLPYGVPNIEAVGVVVGVVPGTNRMQMRGPHDDEVPANPFSPRGLWQLLS